MLIHWHPQSSSAERQSDEGTESLVAVMIESNLVEENQKLVPDLAKLTRGQSVTDACIS